jgi:hypothetical protein
MAGAAADMKGYTNEDMDIALARVFQICGKGGGGRCNPETCAYRDHCDGNGTFSDYDLDLVEILEGDGHLPLK